MTQLDPHVDALVAAALVVAEELRSNDEGPNPVLLSAQERNLVGVADAFLASRHTLREGSKADLEFGSAEALRAEETAVERVGQRAIRLMERLHAGLAERGVPDEGPDAVTRALSTIDAFQTALDEAARDAHVELEAVYDGGLSTDQEIRARALAVVPELDAHSYPMDNRDDLLDWVSDATMRLASLIRDGGPVNGGDQRAFAQGYAEAVRRLRDEDAYRSWWTAKDYPAEQQYWRAEARGHLADYLETLAPDPADPPRVSAEERSDDKSKARPVLDLGGSE